MTARGGDSTLVLLVPEAEAIVGAWRRDHDPSAARGMPAHITVLYPFVAESGLDTQTLEAVQAICANRQPLSVTFRRVGHFPSVLWLDPDSAECVNLTVTVRRRWPDRLPYGRADLDPIPHLTVTDGADEEVMRRAETDVVRHLPLQAHIPAVSLMVFDGATWTVRREFPFGDS